MDITQEVKIETNLSKLSLTDFVEILSSKAPAPGGGGAAALTAAQGCALSAMVCNLTIGKKKYAEFEEDLKRILDSSVSLQRRFLDMIEEDKINFTPLAKAYGLPANTDEEKVQKAKVMEDALKEACKVPVEIVERSYEGIKLHLELMDKGSKLAISDVGVGVEFLRAALISGKMNVLINTGMMKDENYSLELENRVSELVKEGISIADSISEKVMNML